MAVKYHVSISLESFMRSLSESSGCFASWIEQGLHPILYFLLFLSFDGIYSKSFEVQDPLTSSACSLCETVSFADYFSFLVYSLIGLLF